MNVKMWLRLILLTPFVIVRASDDSDLLESIRIMYEEDTSSHDSDTFDLDDESQTAVSYWDGNEYRIFPFQTADQLVRLACLNLSAQRLRALPLKLPPNLITLDLSDNRIREIPEEVNWPVMLERLYLSKNFLSNIPKGLPKGLRYLLLNENKITELSLEGLPECLEILDLDKNMITTIHQGAVAPPRLFSVSLRYQQVKGGVLIRETKKLQDAVNASRGADDQPLKITVG